MSRSHRQIGEVAELVGLSLRTIRYYEEVGLIEPTARTSGRFRLYSEEAVERLRLVMRLEPLDLTLQDTREVLELLAPATHGDSHDRDERVRKLTAYRDVADERAFVLREQAQQIEAVSRSLRKELRRLSAVPASTR